MKTMKTLATCLLMTCFLSTAALAQDKKMDSKMDAQKETLKDHKCTKACTKDKHAYTHGEKGHVCGDACKKMMDKKGKM